MVSEIYGISIRDIPSHHRHQFKNFLGKSRTANRKKEFQSSKKFYTDYPNTQEMALNWKKKYAEKANINIIMATVKTLLPYLGLSLPRVCKTAYPLFVWLSHYSDLFKYLNTFKYFIVTKFDKCYIETNGNPFTEAKQKAKCVEYTNRDLIPIVSKLVNQLFGLGYNVSFVSSLLFDNGEIIFTAVLKRDNKFLNEEVLNKKEISEKEERLSSGESSPKVDERRVILPSIDSLLNLTIY